MRLEVKFKNRIEMRAIKIFVDEVNTDKLGHIIEYLNSLDELVATMVSKDSIFIAGYGDCAIKYAEVYVSGEYAGEISVENVK